jgi:hypothetical protein
MRAAIITLGLSAALGSLTVRAQEPKPAAPERTLIYVDDLLTEDKGLAQDAQALTTSLCAALSKDKRLDVMCGPDVKQILSFAATSAMIGTGSSPANAVEERLNKAKHVVQGTLRKEGANVLLVVKGGPRADAASSTSMFTEKPVVALEEKADKTQKLLDRLPALAQKLGGALLAPPSPPPAPLVPAPKK